MNRRSLAGLGPFAASRAISSRSGDSRWAVRLGPAVCWLAAGSWLAACGGASPGGETTPEGDSVGSPTQQNSAPANTVVGAETLATAKQASDVERVELVLNDDGTMSKFAVYHKDSSSIPEAVRDLAKEKFPQGTIKHFESEWYRSRGVVYEVEISAPDGKDCEISALADGSLIYTECARTKEELSERIRNTIDSLLPGGKIVEAEEKKGPDIDETSVEIDHEGRTHALRFNANDELTERALILPAKLKIPIE